MISGELASEAQPVMNNTAAKTLMRTMYVFLDPNGSESVQGAELVPVKIAKIGEIELARAALAHAGRAFTRSAAGSKASRMPGICLSGRRCGKTDRHTIGARRVLAIDGFCDGEN